jgi:2-polyprenyl-6-methoxyphenol hydroxylase-like FAD-dependent oxidoreductase
MRVVIAGGGIGGLTAALALHGAGAEVVVCEAVRDIQPLGVGINVLPHAMAVFDGFGLTERIAALGVRTSELCYVNRFGQEIWAEPRGLDAGYPVPQVSLHRGRFQLALLAAVRERLGDGAVRTGLRLDRFQMVAPGTVEAVFEDRERGAEIVERADLLIGADGIHSTVRRYLYPQEGPPQWSGNVLWRGVSQGPPFRTGRSMIQGGTRRHKFVAYPIGPAGEDGMCTINWIAELDRRAHGLASREDWNRRGDLADFLPPFETWRWDWLDVPGLIAGADHVYEFPMVDRDPLPRWTSARVTLLGDAAHPMYPIGSNGASQAVLDARALADACLAEPDLDAALVAYEAARRPATAAIVLANRADGPDIVLDWADERAPEGFERASDVFAPGELENLAASYKAVAGFSKDAVRTR